MKEVKSLTSTSSLQTLFKESLKEGQVKSAIHEGFTRLNRCCKLNSKTVLYCRNPIPDVDSAWINTGIPKRIILNSRRWCFTKIKNSNIQIWVPKYNFRVPGLISYYVGNSGLLCLKFEVGKMLQIGSSYDSIEMSTDLLISNLDNHLRKLGILSDSEFCIPSTSEWNIYRVDLFRDFIADLETVRIPITYFNALPTTNSYFRNGNLELQEQSPYCFKGFKDRTALVFYFKKKNDIPVLRIEARYRKKAKLKKAMEKTSSNIVSFRFGSFLENPTLKKQLYNLSLKKFGIPEGADIQIFPKGNMTFYKQIDREYRLYHRIRKKTRDALVKFRASLFTIPKTISEKQKVRRMLNIFTSIGAYPACGVPGNTSISFSHIFTK
jgi:hypothetical protein